MHPNMSGSVPVSDPANHMQSRFCDEIDMYLHILYLCLPYVMLIITIRTLNVSPILMLTMISFLPYFGSVVILAFTMEILICLQ